MTIEHIQNGVVIDARDEREVDLGFYIVLEQMYGERAIPAMGFMSIDLTGMPAEQMLTERQVITDLFYNR